MTKKILLFLFFLFFIFSPVSYAREDETECKTNATDCPAPPGECVEYEGEWIGTWIEYVVGPIQRCEYANQPCDDDSDCRSLWDPDDPYKPADERCTVFYTDDGYCDSEYWTSCCNLTDEEEPTGTPTAGEPTNEPTNPPVPGRAISGSFYEYDGAGFVGNFCGGQTNPSSTSLSGAYITLSSGTDVRNYTLGNTSNFSLNTSDLPTGRTWNITLTLSSSLPDAERLVCACPSAVDVNNPYRCSYFSIGDDVTGVDFYLQPYNMASAWFQTFGGNIFSRSSIESNLPVFGCILDGNCEDSLVAKAPASTNSLTSGFALTSGSVNTAILTNSSLTNPRSFINSSDRTDNLNAYATSVKINTYGYDFYSNQLSGSVDFTSSADTFNLANLRGSDQFTWDANGVNILRFTGDFNIDERRDWNVPNGETVIVLVDGNLNISDYEPDVAPNKIISVEEGGFLAFFVGNNITFDESIGYAIDPASPTIPAVTNANANVEGVFVAYNILTVDEIDATDVPDRKFIGAGNFVGWTNVALNRDFDDGDQGATLSSLQAVENFIFRPDFMINFPNELKVANSNWRELNPQFLNQ